MKDRNYLCYGLSVSEITLHTVTGLQWIFLPCEFRLEVGCLDGSQSCILHLLGADVLTWTVLLARLQLPCEVIWSRSWYPYIFHLRPHNSGLSRASIRNTYWSQTAELFLSAVMQARGQARKQHHGSIFGTSNDNPLSLYAQTTSSKPQIRPSVTVQVFGLLPKDEVFGIMKNLAVLRLLISLSCSQGSLYLTALET